MSVSASVLVGDCLEKLATLPAESIQTCVTSPPYWGLRDYGHAGQIGLEETPDAYVARLVEVFREVRRVLKPDGTLWLNLGDSYAATTKGSSGVGKNATNKGTLLADRSWAIPVGLKPKDLVGIPWRVAFALQADGWWLRSEIIWHKPNPMPESVTDRPTKAHEQVFLLAKSERYFYDAAAVGETFADERMGASGARRLAYSEGSGRADTLGTEDRPGLGVAPARGYRNRRSVWSIASEPYAGAHFATFPEALPRVCILAGSRPGDTVLDPFTGSGTTGAVALKEGRSFVGCELNPKYAELARRRMVVTPALPFAEAL